MTAVVIPHWGNKPRMEIPKIIIGDEEYRFDIAKNLEIEHNTQYKRDLITFFKVSPEYLGDTKIHLFLDYLLKNKYILPTDYLRNIDLGNEVWDGRGETAFNFYSITIRTGGKSHTAALENTMPLAVRMLMARHATFKNAAQIKYDSSAGWEYIGWWNSPKEEVHWKLAVSQTGTYVMTAQVACVQALAGSMVDVIVDKKKFTFTVPATDGWLDFTDCVIDSLVLEAGIHNVVVKAAKVKNGFVCNLQSIVFFLKPD